MEVRTLNGELENHCCFLYAGNANGVDELNLNKHAMVFEKKIK